MEVGYLLVILILQLSKRRPERLCILPKIPQLQMAQPRFTPKPVRSRPSARVQPCITGTLCPFSPCSGSCGDLTYLLLLFLALALGALLCFRLPRHGHPSIQGKVSKTPGCRGPTNLESEIWGWGGP